MSDLLTHDSHEKKQTATRYFFLHSKHLLFLSFIFVLGKWKLGEYKETKRHSLFSIPFSHDFQILTLM